VDERDALVITLRGHIAGMGPPWVEALGHRQAGVGLLDMDDLVAEADQPLLREHLDRLAAGRDATARLRLRLRDIRGEPVPVTLRLDLVRRPDGTPVYVLASLTGVVPGDELDAATVQDAWRRRRVVLWRQPIRDLDSMEVIRHELLVRLLLEDGTLAPASRFVGVLGRLGLGSELDRWIAARAIRLLADDPDPRAVLEANLSAQAPSDRTALLAVLGVTLRDTGVEPGRLVLALPNAALRDPSDDPDALLDGLHRLGVRTAVDGVRGTYAELEALERLPFDVVKLDPAMADDPRALHDVVESAHRQGASTVGERVVDPALLSAMQRGGVDEAQGYHLGPPFGPDTPED
jgi:EAL domain-containing protein (putative c-di-GMP-specific phosphodiesterase class I)